MDQVRAAAGQIWTRRLRGRDAITCRRRTHEKHETCGKRKVNTLPKLFSLFCICWTAETAEAPPCNPEPPGPESSCLQADWNQALLEVEQSSTATREEWKKGGDTDQQNTGEGARASCLLPSGVTRRVRARLWTTGAVCARRCRQRMTGRQRDASRPRRSDHPIVLATEHSGSCCTLLR